MWELLYIYHDTLKDYKRNKLHPRLAINVEIAMIIIKLILLLYKIPNQSCMKKEEFEEV